MRPARAVVGIAAVLIALLSMSALVLWQRSSQTRDAAVASRAKSIIAPPFTGVPLPGFPFFYEFLPGSPRTDVQTGERINERGMNQPTAYPVEKPADTYRIAILGDSIVFGLALDADKNFSSVLERMLNAHRKECGMTFQVFNLGVIGYDFTYEALHFIHTGAQYQPDMVLWQLGQNALLVSTEAQRDLTSRGRTCDGTFIDPVAPTNPQSECERGIEASREEFYKENRGRPGTLARNAEAFEMFSNAYDGPVLFFNINPINRISLGQVVTFAHSRPNTHLALMLPQEGPLLEEGKETVRYNHPNGIGSEIVAKRLFDELQPLISCLAK